jgi:hypothetical protein
MGQSGAAISGPHKRDRAYPRASRVSRDTSSEILEAFSRQTAPAANAQITRNRAKIMIAAIG